MQYYPSGCIFFTRNEWLFSTWLYTLLLANESTNLQEQREESMLRQGQSSWAELPFLPQGGVPPLFSLHLAAQMAGKLIGGRKH